MQEAHAHSIQLLTFPINIHVEVFYCCVSNYLISDLNDHFSAKIQDSASGQFTSGLARSIKRQLVD